MRLAFGHRPNVARFALNCWSAGVERGRGQELVSIFCSIQQPNFTQAIFRQNYVIKSRTYRTRGSSGVPEKVSATRRF